MNDASAPAAETAEAEVWAKVEVFGHRKHYGRISEVERFGTKMLRIDVPADRAGEFETLLYGGGSIFSLEPMTEEAARKWAKYYRPRPASVSHYLPPPDPDEEDTQACEVCDQSFPVEQMHSFEDGWACQPCLDARIEATKTCEHAFQPSLFADAPRSCARCGLVEPAAQAPD